MNAPFAHYNGSNIRWIERSADENFRKALMAGVPPSLRGKMWRALSAIPNPAKDFEHSRRYFGDEFEAVAKRVRPLVELLDHYLENRGFPGLREWLNLTGFANHYEMVKVFYEWAQMKDD